MIVYSAVFIPLERLFAQRPAAVDVPRRVAHRSGLFLRLGALRPGDDAPDDEAGDGALSVGGVSGDPGLGARAVLRRAVHAASSSLTDLTQVLDPPRVSRRACAVALPSDSSLGRIDGLAGGFAAASGRRRRHPRPDVRAHLPARLQRGAARSPTSPSSASRRPSSTPTSASSSGRSPGSWPRRSSITGTTAPRPRRSTRTLPCTCRCSIGCSGPSICRRAAGRRHTGSRTANPSRKGTCVSSRIRSSQQRWPRPTSHRPPGAEPDAYRRVPGGGYFFDSSSRTRIQSSISPRSGGVNSR